MACASSVSLSRSAVGRSIWRDELVVLLQRVEHLFDRVFARGRMRASRPGRPLSSRSTFPPRPALGDHALGAKALSCFGDPYRGVELAVHGEVVLAGCPSKRGASTEALSTELHAKLGKRLASTSSRATPNRCSFDCGGHNLVHGLQYLEDLRRRGRTKPAKADVLVAHGHVLLRGLRRSSSRPSPGPRRWASREASPFGALEELSSVLDGEVVPRLLLGLGRGDDQWSIETPKSKSSRV